jgi:hypothetical protein
MNILRRTLLSCVLATSAGVPGAAADTLGIQEPTTPPEGANDHPAARPATPASFHYTTEDLEGLKWLTGPSGAAAVKHATDLYRGGTVVIHLPSGASASPSGAPYRTALSEEEEVQVLLVLRASHADAALLVIECPEHDPFRILGGLRDLTPGKEATHKGPAPPEEFQLLPIGPPLSCGAGRLRYQVAQTSDLTNVPEASIRLRPVYQLAAIAYLGFDLAHKYSFALDSEKRIARTRAIAGPNFAVGFAWFPGGYDPEVKRLRISPFLVVDPASAKDNFAIGLALSRSRGISLALAASFHKSTVLEGLKEGDSFAGDGEIPTRQLWKRDSLGFVLGISIDSTAFAKIGKAIAAGS